MIDGIYIYGDNAKKLFSFPLNGVTSLDLNALATTETIQHNSSQLIELTPSQLVYVRKVGDLLFFAPCGSTTPPLLAEEIVKRVVTVIESYFQRPITALLITDNRPDIVRILSEMLDTGIPRITQPDIVRQLVFHEDFLSKLVGNGGTSTSSTASSALAAVSQGQGSYNMSNITTQTVPDALVPWDLPWRRSKVKHPRDELYVDIIEHVKAVSSPVSRLRPRSTLLAASRSCRAQVRGEIKLLSKLNDVPHVIIDLSTSAASVLSFERTQLHQAVDLAKFRSSNCLTLSLTPPDLDSVVATYSTETRNSMPVAVDLRRNDGGGRRTTDEESFQVNVSTSIDTKVEHVTGLTVRIVFPHSVRQVKELSATSGDLDVSNPRLCEYRFAKTVPMGWNASLTALATDEEGNSVQPLYIDARYSLIGRIPTQFSVRSIHISHSRQKPQDPVPYKGVRYQTIVESYIVS